MTMPGRPLRIAAFGFRSLPPSQGSAGADKFALELLPRIAARGHQVVAYNRIYPSAMASPKDSRNKAFRGVQICSIPTVARSGFDTLLHSARATWDIIRHNRADVVHIQNGGNSFFAALLRLAGKKTFLSQDGLDWERQKWPWYARLYLRLMSLLTAVVHSEVIFDNVFAREYFEKRFDREYAYIPFGADVEYQGDPNGIVAQLGLKPGSYFLFVGRFIPDKGLQYLIPAFERLKSDKKLVLVGGSPNPSAFESGLRCTNDPRIIFPGFVYGPDMHALMKNCYAYIQPSDVEGLSPVILESSFLGAPVICSGIEQNRYIMQNDGIYFTPGDSDDLLQVLEHAAAHPTILVDTAERQRAQIVTRFSWERVVDEHIALFSRG
jgi:glycosyltransferase involved in cell wall biosynthesis